MHEGEGPVRGRLCPIVAAAALTLLLSVPSVASASALRNYRIWDAGSVIKESWSLCVYPRPGYEWKVYDRTVVEMDDGTDRHISTDSDWYRRGCAFTTTDTENTLQYEGWYWGRLRVRIPATGEVLYSGWKRFWSS
jgi:hypothetical protein